MKKLFLFVLTVMCIFYAFISTLEAKNDPIPQIEFDEDSWDFGIIEQGNIPTHTFTVRNTGNADLIIHRVRSGCGYSIIEPSTQTVKPGKESRIKVSYDSKSAARERVNPVPVGTMYFFESPTTDVNGHIYIDSNDPEIPSAMLAITGEVLPPLIEVDIGVKLNNLDSIISADKEIRRKLTLRNLGKGKLEIRKIKTSSSKYKVDIEDDMVASSIRTYGDIRIKPSKKKKKSTEYIYLEIAIPIEDKSGK